jgi:hypothetical protein
VFNRSFRVSDAVGANQAVEKVVAGPVGDPKKAQKQTETLRKRRFQPPNRGALKSAKEFFNRL